MPTGVINIQLSLISIYFVVHNNTCFWSCCYSCLCQEIGLKWILLDCFTFHNLAISDWDKYGIKHAFEYLFWWGVLDIVFVPSGLSHILIPPVGPWTLFLHTERIQVERYQTIFSPQQIVSYLSDCYVTVSQCFSLFKEMILILTMCRRLHPVGSIHREWW